MAERPNLLLIMTDQQRGDALGCAGNPHIHTPYLDALAASGIRFERAYTESPECVPARALLLSGQWGHRTGVLGNGQSLSPEAPTFVHRLGQVGYRTQAIGKMHFKPIRASHGFDRLELSEEIPWGSWEGDDYLTFLRRSGYGHVDEPYGIRHEYYYHPQVSQLPVELHGTTWTAERAIDFILHAPSDPWFLCVSFVKPHPPFDPAIPFLTLYDPEQLPLPIRSDGPEGWELARAQTYSKWMESTDDNLARLIKAAYYACITQIDEQIGRIMRALSGSGARSSTLVLFTSDHGELMGDHRHFGKRSFWEGGAGIPLLASWPGHLPEGAVHPGLVGLRDISTTLTQAAGAGSFGVGTDLVGLARGEIAARDVTFGELYEGHNALYFAADQRWKYVFAPNGARQALYDIETDPGELVDRADDPTAAPHRNRLRGALLRFFQEDGYRAALSPDASDLLELPPGEIHWGRNRQYSPRRKQSEFNPARTRNGLGPERMP